MSSKAKIRCVRCRLQQIHLPQNYFIAAVEVFKTKLSMIGLSDGFVVFFVLVNVGGTYLAKAVRLFGLSAKD